MINILILKINNHIFDFNSLKSIDMSIFPPDIMAPTFLPLNLLSFIIAARTKAPDISTTSFILSRNSWHASIISDYSTSIISVRYFWITLNVIFPMFVLTPSARVLGGYYGCTDPFCKESLASLARYGSTPMTTVFGLK